MHDRPTRSEQDFLVRICCTRVASQFFLVTLAHLGLRVHQFLSRPAVPIIIADAVDTGPKVRFHLEKSLREGAVSSRLLCL